MKTVITERQRGLKFKNGIFEGVLTPGKYRHLGGTKIELLSLDAPVATASCTLNTMLKNKAFSEAVTVIEVSDTALAFHYLDGKFNGVLRAGKYAFWKALGEHSFTLADISVPEVSADIPEYIFQKIPTAYYTKAEVAEHERARLYYNGRLVRLLTPGTYYFWKSDVKVTVETVDTRLLQLNIVGQEMLTRDKVTIRINLVCRYKITDFIKIATEIEGFEEQLRVAAQLAVRDYVGACRLDELLEKKEELSVTVFKKLKAKEAELFISLQSADVKDIILPGEIRDIMNTVLVAEKKAQANVITRREEVASTRSLLNTAKLMEENPTLYKLKELEYVERICENVGNINVSGGGSLIAELTGILRGTGA